MLGWVRDWREMKVSSQKVAPWSQVFLHRHFLLSFIGATREADMAYVPRRSTGAASVFLRLEWLKKTLRWPEIFKVKLYSIFGCECEVLILTVQVQEANIQCRIWSTDRCWKWGGLRWGRSRGPLQDSMMHGCSFPDKIPHKHRQMPQVRFMGSMHKESNQDEPTKNQETEPQRANPESSPPCFSSYKSRSGDALWKRRERTLGIWAIVNIKGDLKYPLAKLPKRIWLLIHFSILQD